MEKPYAIITIPSKTLRVEYEVWECSIQDDKVINEVGDRELTIALLHKRETY